MPKTYTAQEATRTLVYVRPIADEIAERYAHLQELTRRHEAKKITPEARETLRREIQEAAVRLQECQEELRRIHVDVKDYEMGLLDFPALLDGRPILLCWKRGEAAVTHWHEPDAGYAGRRTIPEGKPGWPREVTAAPAAPE